MEEQRKISLITKLVLLAIILCISRFCALRQCTKTIALGDSDTMEQRLTSVHRRS